jgi:hypothetical protein
VQTLKSVATLVLLMAGTTVIADEYYELYSIQCLKPISVVRVESFGVYNIGDQIWPPATDDSNRAKWLREQWKRHETNLRALEKNYGLYVFGEMYGRYSKEPVVCNLTHFMFSAAASAVERTYVDDNIKLNYRGAMKVTITAKDGKVLFEQHLRHGMSLHAYDHTGDGVVLEVCTPSSATDARHPWDSYMKSCDVEIFPSATTRSDISVKPDAVR